jgi:hypothetical protein
MTGVEFALIVLIALLCAPALMLIAAAMLDVPAYMLDDDTEDEGLEKS